jgi:hypothetical protein
MMMLRDAWAGRREFAAVAARGQEESGKAAERDGAAASKQRFEAGQRRVRGMMQALYCSQLYLETGGGDLLGTLSNARTPTSGREHTI